MKSIRELKTATLKWKRLEEGRMNYELSDIDGSIATLRYDDPRALGESGMVAETSEGVYSLSSQSGLFRSRREIRRLDASLKRIGELSAGSRRNTWSISIDGAEDLILRRLKGGRDLGLFRGDEALVIIRPEGAVALHGGTVEIQNPARFEHWLSLAILICWYSVLMEYLTAQGILLGGVAGAAGAASV
jgi:hypothetical protein